MKVLWITNTVFPDLAKALGNSAPVVGGWMYGLAKDLVNNGVKLTVATSRLNQAPITTSINQIGYYLLRGNRPATLYDSSLERQWVNLIEKVEPDIVHIHGTEYSHGLSLLKSSPQLRSVISIQGMISVYARYYTGSIPFKKIKQNITFRDIIKQDGIHKSQRMFEKRGNEIEKQYFKYTNDFIGRTQWDFDHVKTLNANANYHFCNESLRDNFYTASKWNIKTKNDYTIFLSQAGYPIKGLHQVIEAVSIIKSEFKHIKIRVAGDDITHKRTFKDKLAIGGYGKYILSKLKKYNLQDCLEFTGYLDADQMIDEYQKCHLFICPSSIENSPNSLGEAQILGTPCIASYVGGIPDMVEHGKSGLLYRFEEVEMLAQAIKSVFINNSLANKLSINGITAASQRHDRKINLNKTLCIYQNIIS